jgi:GTP1/Obg family GTP-binding protein
LRLRVRRLPKSFKLLGHTITVRIVSVRDWEAIEEEHELEDAVACWAPHLDLILIKRQPRQQMLHSFYHELTHAVLDMLNDKLSWNEKFVDNFGGLLAQAMDTAE